MANQNFRVKNGLEVGSVQIASDGGVINSSALPDSGASAGTTGSSSAIPVITVNAKGLVTNVQSAAVSGVDSFVYTPANTTFVLTSGGSPLAQTILFDSDDFTANATGVHFKRADSSLASNSTGTFVNASAISITGLAGYDANEHIDHSTVSVIAGNGLTGGGDITADRTLTVGAGDAIAVNSTAVSVNAGAIDIAALDNYDANKFIDHTGVTLTAGNGLTGGGTIAASRSFAVKANTGIVANSSGLFSDDSAISHDGLSGFVSNEHIDHSGVNITAGSGLTGGGDITATRTLNVGQGNGVTVSADQIDVNGGTGLISNNSGVHVAVSNGLTGGASYLRVLAGTGVVSNATGVHIGQAVGTSDDVTFNDLVVSGNLTVSGTQTTVSTATLAVTDAIITVAKDQTGTPSLDAGIEVERGSSANAQLLWDESQDRWIQKLAGGTEYVLHTKQHDIALGTDTSGNYVDNVTAGVGLAVTGSAGEGWEPAVAVVANTGITANSSGVFTNDSEINHDSLSGFVSNEHIDHSSVTLTAGNGLTGGGDITASRSFAVVGGTGVTSNGSGIHIGQSVGTSDSVTFNDVTVSANAVISSLQDSSNRVLKIYNSSGSLVWG
jgi:hypothetical protein